MRLFIFASLPSSSVLVPLHPSLYVGRDLLARPAPFPRSDKILNLPGPELLLEAIVWSNDRPFGPDEGDGFIRAH